MTKITLSQVNESLLKGLMSNDVEKLRSLLVSVENGQLQYSNPTQLVLPELVRQRSQRLLQKRIDGLYSAQ